MLHHDLRNIRWNIRNPNGWFPTPIRPTIRKQTSQYLRIASSIYHIFRWHLWKQNSLSFPSFRFRFFLHTSKRRTSKDHIRNPKRNSKGGRDTSAQRKSSQSPSRVMLPADGWRLKWIHRLLRVFKLDRKWFWITRFLTKIRWNEHLF